MINGMAVLKVAMKKARLAVAAPDPAGTPDEAYRLKG